MRQMSSPSNQRRSSPFLGRGLDLLQDFCREQYACLTVQEAAPMTVIAFVQV